MKRIVFSLLALSLLFTACKDDKEDGDDKKEAMNAATENKTERNKKVVMASMNAIVKGDIDMAVKDAAADFTDYNDGSMPPTKNIDSVKGFIKMILNSIEGYKPTDIMLIAEGDYVAAHATWSGLFKNDLMGIKATGKMISFPDVDIFKINADGMITEHRSVQNTGAVLMASGMMK